LNTILAWAQPDTAEDEIDLPSTSVASKSLADYLKSLPYRETLDDEPRPRVVVFDQFE
jgi:hypothetical protein